MSHRALQHAAVIALHDGGFVEDMHRDPEATLGPLGLSPEERAQILAVDPRAFRTDPLRRRRTLRILSEEFRASTTLVLHEKRSLGLVEGFFSSTLFRGAVAERRPLAPAFGAYLGGTGARAPLFDEVVRLETLLCRCRRERDQPPACGIALAPGVAVDTFDAGTLPAVQAIERYVFELALMPQAALCADAPPVPVPEPAGRPMRLLVTPAASGVSLATIDEDLYRVLAALRAPIERKDAAAALAPARVPAARAGELVQSLLEDGLLAELIATPTA